MVSIELKTPFIFLVVAVFEQHAADFLSPQAPAPALRSRQVLADVVSTRAACFAARLCQPVVMPNLVKRRWKARQRKLAALKRPVPLVALSRPQKKWEKAWGVDRRAEAAKAGERKEKLRTDKLKKAAELILQASCSPSANRRMWLERAQLQMGKTYAWIEDRYADDLLGPDGVVVDEEKKAAEEDEDNAPLTDLEVMQKKPNFSRKM